MLRGKLSPIKYEILRLFWFNVGSASATLVKHLISQGNHCLVFVGVGNYCEITTLLTVDSTYKHRTHYVHLQQLRTLLDIEDSHANKRLTLGVPIL